MKTPTLARVFFVCALLLPLFNCTLFRKKIPPYPTGIMFPIEEAFQIQYEGEINNPMKKRGTLVFISTRAGSLYCIEGSLGKIRWQTQVSETLVSPPFLGKENIYVLDRGNNLYCLNAGGEILWQRIIGEEITSRITEFGEHVCMGTASGWFLAIDISKGKRTWAFKTEDAIRSNPVVSDGKIIFGSDDLHLYVLSVGGNLIHKFAVGGRIGATLATDGDCVYLGSGNREIVCYDVRKLKRKWKVRAGGELLVPPVFHEQRAYFVCMDNVLYCLNKNGGDILWWSVTPSRAFYHLMIVNDRIIVTSLSSLLMSYDVKSGEKIGEFQGAHEMRSNPTWCEPYVLVNRYDSESDQGTLLFFQKLVAVELSPSKASPQKINEDILLTATPFGFYMPEYEFTLTPMLKWPLTPYFFLLVKAGEKQVVQDNSEKRTWEWFPEKEGIYSVGVTVTDEKENAESEIPFLILKEDAAVVLAQSMDPPQELGTEITFIATSQGMDSPEYEFRLQRVHEIVFFTHMSMFVPGQKKIVQDFSEENSWTWNPTAEGLFVIHVSANDGLEEVGANVVFSIIKRKKNGQKNRDGDAVKNDR